MFLRGGIRYRFSKPVTWSGCIVPAFLITAVGVRDTQPALAERMITPDGRNLPRYQLILRHIFRAIPLNHLAPLQQV